MPGKTFSIIWKDRGDELGWIGAVDRKAAVRGCTYRRILIRPNPNQERGPAKPLSKIHGSVTRWRHHPTKKKKKKKRGKEGKLNKIGSGRQGRSERRERGIYIPAHEEHPLF